MSATLIHSRWDPLREIWLERQSTESLAERSRRRDADIFTRYLYGLRLVESNATSQALDPIAKACDSITDSIPSDLTSKVLSLASYVSADAGDNRSAADSLDRAAKLGRGDVFLHLSRGVLALNRQRVSDAVDEILQAVRIDSRKAVAWRHLGSAYLRGAEPKMAVDAYQNAVKILPNDPLIHSELALAFGANRQYSEAEAEMKNAARLSFQFAVMPTMGRTIAARTEAEFKSATNELTSQLDTHPEDYRTRLLLAGLQMRRGEYSESQRHFETYLAHKPDNGGAWLNLSIVAERAGDLKTAAIANARFKHISDALIDTTELKKQAIQHPESPEVFVRLSEAFKRGNQLREAVQAMERAAALKPGDPTIDKRITELRSKMPPSRNQSESTSDGTTR